MSIKTTTKRTTATIMVSSVRKSTMKSASNVSHQSFKSKNFEIGVNFLIQRSLIVPTNNQLLTLIRKIHTICRDSWSRKSLSWESTKRNTVTMKGLMTMHQMIICKKLIFTKSFTCRKTRQLKKRCVKPHMRTTTSFKRSKSWLKRKILQKTQWDQKMLRIRIWVAVRMKNWKKHIKTKSLMNHIILRSDHLQIMPHYNSQVSTLRTQDHKSLDWVKISSKKTKDY